MFSLKARHIYLRGVLKYTIQVVTCRYKYCAMFDILFSWIFFSNKIKSTTQANGLKP